MDQPRQKFAAVLKDDGAQCAVAFSELHVARDLSRIEFVIVDPAGAARTVRYVATPVSLEECSAWQKRLEQVPETANVCLDRALILDLGTTPPRREGNRKPVPDFGPGTELKGIFESLGIKQKEGCGGCAARMQIMNLWGVAGCRTRFHEIVGWMKDGQANYSNLDKVKAAAAALASGLAFKVDWSDPFPGLIQEAIRRAELKQPPPAPA